MQWFRGESTGRLVKEAMWVFGLVMSAGAGFHASEFSNNRIQTFPCFFAGLFTFSVTFTVHSGSSRAYNAKCICHWL